MGCGVQSNVLRVSVHGVRSRVPRSIRSPRIPPGMPPSYPTVDLVHYLSFINYLLIIDHLLYDLLCFI